MVPEITDNGKDTISVSHGDYPPMESWRYTDDAERRAKMREAEDWVDGYIRALNNLYADTIERWRT